MQSIILLHGALGTAQSMLSLSKELDSYADVHILEFSGHGESAWPEDGLSVEVFEQDVLHFMDDRDLKEAHIFGYSMGGFIGLRLALAFPDRIRSVTTLATKFDWTEEACIREGAMLDADTLEAKVPKFIIALDKAHTRNGWRLVVEETRQVLESMSRYRFSADDFARMTTPIRLLVGDRDKMVRLDETVEAFRSLPNAGLGVLPGTPHPLEMADRDLVALHIRGMISGPEA